jgi:hypothetical protein
MIFAFSEGDAKIPKIPGLLKWIKKHRKKGKISLKNFHHHRIKGEGGKFFIKA